MSQKYDKLYRDVRYIEGLNACMNCGVCTAICPAAEFYDYDPRVICNTLLSRDDQKIENLLVSDTIWYCGQCLSCKTRCPRGNVPALLISALRHLSQETGLFIHSMKGRQQYAIMKTIGKNILSTGYCVHPDLVDPQLHPEQGPVWKWYRENTEEVSDKLGANYNKEGAGALRKIPKKNLDEIHEIFKVTGGDAFRKKVEKISEEKAKELGFHCEDEIMNSEYFFHLYTSNNETDHS